MAGAGGGSAASSVAEDRPQDVGRSHSRKSTRDPQDAALLDRYVATMRLWLGQLLDGLQPAPPAPGLGLLEADPVLDRAKDKDWDLAIRLAKELGSSMDQDPALPAGPPAPPRRPQRARPTFK